MSNLRFSYKVSVGDMRKVNFQNFGNSQKIDDFWNYIQKSAIKVI